MKKIALWVIAAILFSLVSASSASVSFSYTADTSGRLMVGEDYRFNTHANPIVGSRYSLDLTARNSEIASCIHDFSVEDREVNTGTDVMYLSNTSRMLRGLHIAEKSGASLIIEKNETGNKTFVGCSDSTIGFSARVDSLQRFVTTGWIKDGSQTYAIDTKGKGNYDANLYATSSEGEGLRNGAGGCAGSCNEYILRSTERISSHVGGRFGDFNFTARYNVTRPWI
ncbi:MAG: hypothetical protein N2V75_02595 [Methanophagales archaeon]|nr:hypothetical protein [Methanophagales archaeon]